MLNPTIDNSISNCCAYSKDFFNTLTNKAQVIKRINCTYLSFYNYFTFNKDKRFQIIFKST